MSSHRKYGPEIVTDVDFIVEGFHLQAFFYLIFFVDNVATLPYHKYSTPKNIIGYMYLSLLRVICLRASSRASMSFQTRTGLTSQMGPRISYPNCWFGMPPCASVLLRSSSILGCRGWVLLYLCSRKTDLYSTSVRYKSIVIHLIFKVVISSNLLNFFHRMLQREVFQLLMFYRGMTAC